MLALLAGSGESGVGSGGVLDSLPHDAPAVAPDGLALAPVETSMAGISSRILPDSPLPKRAEPKAGAEAERVPPHSR